MPFLVCHTAVHLFAWRALNSGNRDDFVLCLIGIPLLLVLQLLTFLGTRWSVQWKCAVSFSRTSEDDGEWALVEPEKNGGRPGLVKLERDEVKGLYFSFQKRTYVREKGEWVALSSPHAGMTVREYAKALSGGSGLSDAELVRARAKWGENEFKIPDPTFFELFEEHYLAPFFVFQVACCVLWSLDEYWLYSAFTLIMLLVFEATLCAQRFRSLDHLRSVKRPPRLVYALRDGHWRPCLSNDLVPGDVASFSCLRPNNSRLRQQHQPIFFAPCDAVVIRGSCVVNEAMLTGESVPQRKDALAAVSSSSEGDEDDAAPNTLDFDGSHRRHVVFGGTEILDASSQNSAGAAAGGPPDGGVVVHVVRTGFETSQGQLMRTILYATERVVGSTDSAAFIAVLLTFAVAAALYVLREGLKDDPPRNRFKLCLHCVLIITSVVPPELPMELSLAVTNSLAALTRAAVFCTEPFRIAFAGAVNVCCFDKTGTLTRDELTLCGVVVDGTFVEDICKVQREDTMRVLGCCHSLVALDDRSVIVGDSLERAQFQGLRNNWRLVATDQLRHLKKTFRIVKRFAFASELRRMSCVVVEEQSKAAWVVCKGAPEVLKPLLASVPADYDATWRARANRGERVLALASRQQANKEWRRLHRSDAENSLDFCGFVSFSSPLKPGTSLVIQQLLDSKHRCVMITGDGALTAAHVARQVGIFTKYGPDAAPPDILVSGARWQSLSSEDDGDGPDDPFSRDEIAARASTRDLVVRGDGLTSLIDARDVKAACLHALVFARVAPKQKEQIVDALNSAGSMTLMCGDGTNDVGALKRAHVGISIMNSPVLESRLERAFQENMPAHMVADVEMNVLDLDPTLVNLGDASIASPFSSKRATIDCVLAIVRQGRCTLVTMLQVFKILALMCLVSAYMLSSLNLHGVKQGDTQLTVVGLATAFFFFLLSRAQPLEKLASKRPPQRVFELRQVFSIVTQFSVHLGALVVTMRLCRPFAPKLHRSHVPDGAFSPSVVNTAVFLLSTVVQINIFATNYQGHPFMQSLAEHKPLAYVSLSSPFSHFSAAGAYWSRPTGYSLSWFPG